jgi:hypothetical protein
MTYEIDSKFFIGKFFFCFFNWKKNVIIITTNHGFYKVQVD